MSFKVSNSIPARINNNSISGLVTIQNDVSQYSNTPQSSFVTFIAVGNQNASGAFGNVNNPRNVPFSFSGFGDTTLLSNNSPVRPNSNFDIFTFSQPGVYDVSYTLCLAKNFVNVTPPFQSSAINIQSYIIVNNPDGTLKWKSTGFITKLFISQSAAGVSSYTTGSSTTKQSVIIKDIKKGDTISVQTSIVDFITGSDGNYMIFRGGTLNILKQ